MAAYTTRLRPDYTAGRVDVPDVGGIFLDFADRQMKQHQIGLDNAMQQAKMEEDKRRYETELGFKQRQEQRVMDELNRAQATREGVLATLDPKAYQDAKIADMENQMRAGLANLSPQDRAEAEKQWAANFNRGATGEYVNRLATTNANVDPSVLLSTQVSMQNKALNDPTSELYKAKQLDEWNQKKREYDYKHKLDMAKVNAQKADEQKGLDNALNMLNVSTMKTLETGSNKQEIENIKNQNAKVYEIQKRYGDAYEKAAIANPKAEHAELDRLARATAGITASAEEGDIGKLYPLEAVPDMVVTTKQVPKTEQEYARDIFNEVSKGKVTAGNLQVADSLTKSYKAAIEANRDKEAKKAIVQDYKSLIDNLGGNSSNVTTEDGAKAQLKAIEAKIKANKGDSGKNNGLGVETVKAVDSTGLDADDFEAVRQEAVKRKIGDKELAALILAGNRPGSWGVTSSTTQRDDILKYLKDYPLK